MCVCVCEGTLVCMCRILYGQQRLLSQEWLQELHLLFSRTGYQLWAERGGSAVHWGPVHGTGKKNDLNCRTQTEKQQLAFASSWCGIKVPLCLQSDCRSQQDSSVCPPFFGTVIVRCQCRRDRKMSCLWCEYDVDVRAAPHASLDGSSKLDIGALPAKEKRLCGCAWACVGMVVVPGGCYNVLA